MGPSDKHNKAPPVQESLPDMPAPAAGGSAALSAGEPAGLLALAVQSEIIPRLVRAHGSAPGAAPRPPTAAITQVDVDHLTELVLNADDIALHEAVAALRERGASVQSVFLDLLTPVARKLGEFWTCDSCSFTDVTMAMGRLQQLLRSNSAAFGLGLRLADDHGSQRRILLMPSPGEQHTFGLSLVAEFFYRAGWDVSTSFLQPSGPLAALVEREWFDVVGLSLGNVAQVGRLEDTLRQIRRASMNPQVLTIVGGVAFMLEPSLVERVSADAVITDAQAAPELAQSLLKQSSLQP